MDFSFLTHGIDTLEVSYYLASDGECALDYVDLTAKREAMRRSKSRVHKVIRLGSEEFALAGHGTSSGHPLFMQNDWFEVGFGEFNQPNFYVKYDCSKLWHEGYSGLHNRFLAWAASVGLRPYKPEGISRLDYAYDYVLPEIDFDRRNFVSQSKKGTLYFEGDDDDNFDFGAGNKKIRVYNKSKEIKQRSGKEWFYPLWGDQSENVWRIEWQTRKEPLKNIGLRTINDLGERIGDLLRDLATEHTTLRTKTDDSNKSRWPLHPLWADYIDRIAQMPVTGIVREYKPEIILEARLRACEISVYGYLKRIAAITCLTNGKEKMGLNETLNVLRVHFLSWHNPITWEADVAKRIEEMRFGL